MSSSRLSERLESQRRRGDGGRRWVRVVMAVLATIGVIDTGSITLSKLGLVGHLSCSSVGWFGCTGCDQVLDSPWGTLFGVPLAFFGLLAYSAVLLMAVLPLVLKGDLRVALTRRSWWGLFFASTGMAVFSGVLLGVMHFGVEACCVFCLLSAGLSTGLFVLSLIGGDWQDRGQLIFSGVLTAVLVLLVGSVWAFNSGHEDVLPTATGVPSPVITESGSAQIALAEHLSSSGAKVYTAWWCGACRAQKELFGRQAVEKLNVIECSQDGRNNQAELCKSKEISAYPTWEINGQLDSGVKPLAELAEASGYQGPALK